MAPKRDARLRQLTCIRFVQKSKLVIKQAKSNVVFFALSIRMLHETATDRSTSAGRFGSDGGFEGLALIHPTYFPSGGRPLSGLQRIPAENRPKFFR